MITPLRIVAAAGFMLATALFSTIGHAQNAQWQVLRDDPQIHEGLTVIAVGNHMQDVCGDIRPRMVRAWSYAERLMSRATSLGLSRAEVEAYVDDRTEQARYDRVMEQWFAARGATHTDTGAVCRLARDEITAGSQIGRLLR